MITISRIYVVAIKLKPMIDRKTLYFWFICVPLRILFIVIAALFFEEIRIPLMVITGFQSLFFMASAFFKRKSGCFGPERWWFSSIHGFFYFVFVVLASMKIKQAYLALTIDLVFGVVHWIIRNASIKN
jgi:hypothetical protein